MKIECKSLLIGRMKGEGTDEDHPYLVSVKPFNVNDPHLTAELPLKELEFSMKKRVVIHSKETIYCPTGNDLVFNNLSHVDIVEEGEILKIKII